MLLLGGAPVDFNLPMLWIERFPGSKPLVRQLESLVGLWSSIHKEEIFAIQKYQEGWKDCYLNSRPHIPSKRYPQRQRMRTQRSMLVQGVELYFVQPEWAVQGKGWRTKSHKRWRAVPMASWPPLLMERLRDRLQLLWYVLVLDNWSLWWLLSRY